MALKKTKTLPSGVSGEYWKIISETYDRINHQVTWQIALFKDQAHRTGEHLGIIKQFSRSINAEEATGNRTALGYNTIKQQSSEMITCGVSGLPLPEPIARDPDLCDAEDV